MAVSVCVRDETATGELVGELRLADLEDRVTVRDLIAARVVEEVRIAKLNIQPRRFLVAPTSEERIVNGERKPRQLKVNIGEQVEKALQAFRSNQFFLLVDDRQITDLDAEINIKVDTRISFLRLTPLMGG